MQLVMDLMFCDVLSFVVPRETIVEIGPSRSVEEHWTKLCAAVGIELVDYDTVQVEQNLEKCTQQVELMGAAWLRKK